MAVRKKKETKPDVYQVRRGSHLDLPDTNAWARAGQYVDLGQPGMKEIVEGQMHKLNKVKTIPEGGVKCIAPPSRVHSDLFHRRGHPSPYDRMIRTSGPGKRVVTK